MKTDVFVRHACVNTVITISKREQIFLFVCLISPLRLAGDFAYDTFFCFWIFIREC